MYLIPITSLFLVLYFIKKTQIILKNTYYTTEPAIYPETIDSHDASSMKIRKAYADGGSVTKTYDAAGNQTLVKTTTGIWTVAYDAENRPVSFTNTETNTVMECSYDHMGRRATKKVTVNGSVTLHHRYLYRGFLQIDSGAPLCAFTLSGQTLRVCPTGLTAVVRFACCDLTRSNHPSLWLIRLKPQDPHIWLQFLLTVH